MATSAVTNSSVDAALPAGACECKFQPEENLGSLHWHRSGHVLMTAVDS